MSQTQFKGGPLKQQQSDFVLSANSRKVMDGMLVPGTVVTADPSAAAVRVGKGNVVRLRITTATFVAFADAPDASLLATVSSSTSPGLELNSAGVYLVVATGEFMKTSANPARIEVVQG